MEFKDTAMGPGRGVIRDKSDAHQPAGVDGYADGIELDSLFQRQLFAKALPSAEDHDA